MISYSKLSELQMAMIANLNDEVATLKTVANKDGLEEIKQIKVCFDIFKFSFFFCFNHSIYLLPLSKGGK